MGRIFDWDDYLAGEPKIVEPPALDAALSAPQPYFGGKGRAAELIWERLGDVTNYIEAFGGSFAVGLKRPAWHRARVETCNDLDGLLVNALRSIARCPDEVAAGCDWPVTEVDLHARHKALVAARVELTAKLEADPYFCDAELAAFWIWGASCWIGDGWCLDGKRQLPSLGGGGASQAGVNGHLMRKPARQLPDLGGSTKGDATFPNAGKGVHAGAMRVQRRLPSLGGSGSTGMSKGPRGVCSMGACGPQRQMPRLSGATHNGQSAVQHGGGIHGLHARTALHDTFARLAGRLRYVRFPCGDWKRVMTPAVTWRHGLTGILLDPPYDDGVIDYAVGGRISSEVRAWCVEHWNDRLPNGDPAYHLALCGYAGEHDELESMGWECVAWKARGGYGNQRKDGENENARRERIWFSPNCLRVAERPHSEQLSLIGGAL